MTSVIMDDLSSFTAWFRIFLMVTIVFIILIYTMVYWQRGKHMRKLADKLPGPPTLPFIGNINLFVAGDLTQTFKAARGLGDYGTTVRVWLGNQLFICVSDHVGAERITGNKNFLSRTEYANKILKPLLKNGILISEGETWKLHRRMLAPHFRENILRKYISIFYRQATTLVDRLENFADGSSLFNIYELAFFCTMNTAWETSTGATLSKDLSENIDIPRNALRAIDMISERFRRPWLIFDWIYNFTSMKKEFDLISHYFQKLTEGVLEERMKEFNESGTRTNLENVTHLVDQLLMDGQLTKEEMHEQTFSILGAASETTANLYCYTMCMLGVYQDVQERLFQEQKCIFQDDPHREVSWEDLQKMTYTEQIMRRVLQDLSNKGQTARIIGIKDLQCNVFYTVVSVRSLNTHYGLKTVLKLQDCKEVFLPSAYGDLDEDEIQQLNESHFTITHKGMESVQNTNFQRHVLKEVMRLYPPFPLLIRTIEEDTDVGNGFVLPEGSNAVVFTFLLHRNPRYFPDPEKFDPERFSAKNSEGRHPYCYLPFGAGRRNCMGYKYGMLLVKMMLSISLRRYRVVNTVGGREAIDESLELGIIMKPASGYNFQIALRDVT